MVKKSKFKYIISSIVIGITSLLIVLFSLLATGVIGHNSSSNYDLVIKTNSNSKFYDNTPLFDYGYQIESGSLLEDDKLVVEFSNSITNVGKVDNVATCKVLNKEDKDVSSHYHFKFDFGTLEVHPSPITITSKSANKIYDGEPLSCNEFFISNGEIYEGDEIKINFINSITDAGSVKNDFNFSFFDSESNDVTKNYDVTKNLGNLVVEKKSLTFSSNDTKKVYDGTSIDTGEVTLTNGKLLEGHSFEIYNQVSIQNIGSAVADFDVQICDENKNDVTNNYEINKKTGSLQILPIELQFKTGSSKKTYDGNPLSNNEITLLNEDILKDNTIEYKTVNSIVNVGIINNDPWFSIKDKNGNDITKNYAASDKFIGKLEVVPLKIDIKTASNNKKYDGKPLTDYNYEIKSTNKLLDGHTIELFFSGKQIEVGYSNNTVQDFIIYDENKKDITFNYSVEIVEGVLTVTADDFYAENDLTKVQFKILSEETGHFYFKNKSYGYYDGFSWMQSLPNDLYIKDNNSINPQYFIAEQLKSIGMTSSKAKITPVAPGFAYHYPYYQDNFDSTNQRYDYTVLCDYNDFYYCDLLNFDYKNESHLLDEAPAEIKQAESNYYEFVKAHYLQLPKTTKDFMLNYASENEITSDNPNLILAVADLVSNAAKYDLNFPPFPIGVDPAIYFLSEAESGVCRHYACSAACLYRALGIPARYVVGFAFDTKKNEEVEVLSKSRHAWVEVYIPGNGWVAVEVTGTTNDGSGGSGSDPKKELNITPYPTRKLYDGTTLHALNKVMGLEKLSKYGYSYECTIEGERLKVGTSESKIKVFRIYNRKNKDITNLFKITKHPGIVQVYERIVDIKTNSKSKVYDGTPLQDDNYEILSPIEGLTVQNVKFAEPNKYVGKYLNYVTLTLVDENNKDVSDSIYFRYQYGILEITPRPITITTASNSKEYDGEPLFDHNYTVDNLASTDKIVVVLRSEINGIGSCDNLVSSIFINQKDNEDEKINLNYCYEITVITGKLEVYY